MIPTLLRPAGAVLVTALLLAAPAAAQSPAPAAEAPTGGPRLTLARAVELAQERGNDARAAEASRRAAYHTDRAFYAAYRPRLALSGTLPSYNRTIVPVVQPDGGTLFRPQNQTQANLSATVTQRLPTGGDLFVSSSLASYALSGEQTVRTWSSTPVSVGIRQDLLRPNYAALDRREQPIRTEVAEREFLEAREDIALETTNLFFDVHAARVALDNAATNVAVNDTLFTLNKGRFEVGKIGENDLLQSELALLRARNSLDGARLAYERALAALRIALALPADAPIELEVPGAAPEYAVDTAQAAVQALRNRAAAAGVALQTAQADREVSIARLENGLGASVQASIGFNATASDLDLAYRDLLEARRVAVEVEVPLLQWGQRKHRVGAAEAAREEVQTAGRAMLDQIALDARFAALEFEQTRRALEISAKADTVAAKRFEVAYNRYVIGRITIDNLYVAQAEKDQALTGYLQALRAHWNAHYRLRRLTLYDFAAGSEIR